MVANPNTEPHAVSMSLEIQKVIGAIADAQLRGQVETTVRHCLAALHEIGRIHLPQDHFELHDGQNLDDPQHLDAAPYVLAAVVAVNRLISHLMETYPAPPESDDGGTGLDDFDLDFDLVDSADGGGLSGRAAADEKQMTPPEEVADAAHAYGGMLRSRVVSFGGRLRGAARSGDAWKILGELDDYQHRIAKSVQAVLFGVLGVFTNDASREDILPQYRSAVGESVALRQAITDLAYHIGRFNESLADPEIAVPLMVGVADRLTRFSARPVYRSLRAEDKKAVIDFRRELYEMRHNQRGDLNMSPLRHCVEGFARFLESMTAINHREVLVLHDRRAIETALAQVADAMNLAGSAAAGARSTLDGIVDGLGVVTGRNPDLDAVLRGYRDSEPASRPVATDLQTLMTALQATAAMVG